MLLMEDRVAMVSKRTANHSRPSAPAEPPGTVISQVAFLARGPTRRNSVPEV